MRRRMSRRKRRKRKKEGVEDEKKEMKCDGWRQISAPDCSSCGSYSGGKVEISQTGHEGVTEPTEM